MRVLVIDDEPTLLSALRRVLAPTHEVTEASDGEQALGLLVQGEFDLVLCDLMMGGLEGVDVYERSIALRPELERRFLFMTGGALSPRSIHFKAELGARCIDKPFDARTIAAVVQRFAAEAPTRRLRPAPRREAERDVRTVEPPSARRMRPQPRKSRAATGR